MNKKAFTLIELMVAVTMIAILAMIVIPQSNYLIARARCTEAVVAIKTYERMQSSYYTAMGEIGSLADLGIEMPNAWFTYSIDVSTTASLNHLSGGVAVAKAKETGAGTTKVDLCHIPPGNPENAHVISVGTPSYDAHQAHGDGPAPCPGASPASSGSSAANEAATTSPTSSSSENSVAGYELPVILIIATVNKAIAYNCRVNDAVYSEWTPLGVLRGDVNTGSCTGYMGQSFVE